MFARYCLQCAGNLRERLVDSKARLVCESCGFVFYQSPKLAAAVVVLEEGKILLNKRDIEPGRGCWSFPSGYVDVGETVEDAAVREAKEETGLDVRLDRLVGVYSNRERPVVLVVYAASIVGGNLYAGNEVQAVGRFGIHELPEMAFEHDREIIESCINGAIPGGCSNG